MFHSSVLSNVSQAIVLAATVALPARALAVSLGTDRHAVSDLALHCGGEYLVVESTPYFKDNRGTRAPNFAGTNEKIKVLSVHGADCQKLAKHYGVEVTKGEILTYGVSTGESYEAAVAAAKARKGHVLPYKVQQTVHFAAADGTLPLFPLIHQEEVFLLSKEGSADAKALYGTPAQADLTDDQVLNLVNSILWQVDWGKAYQQQDWGDEWLWLLLKLQPKAEVAKKDYAGSILTLFQNISHTTASFVSASPGVEAGQTLNALLNELGGTQWSTKMAVFKHNPMLFDDQLVSWARIDDGPSVGAPHLEAAEVEEFLTFALAQIQILNQVNWITEANTVLYQFKAAAASIKHAAEPNGSLPPLYVLTPKAADLIAKIAAF